MPMSSALVGNAGAYIVAARLSALGLICAPTFRNTPKIDLLVSDETGASFVSLQVKTAMSAMREGGRGQQKQPHHYEWAMNWTSAQLNVQNLYFALVDLKRFNELPDIFIVPSHRVFAWFEERNATPETWRWPRYHPSVETLAPYKNNFDSIFQHLGMSAKPN
jgi:hypothetical protein